MKNFLITLLCVSIFLFSNFTSVKTDNYTKIESANKKELVESKKESNIVKTDNNEKDSKEEIEVLENEQEEIETGSSYGDETSTTDESTYSYTPATVNYGTYGRLYIPGFNVALYDFNVNTSSSLSLQTLVDNSDSAAYYINRGKLVIADHDYQGFSTLSYLSEGTTAYIQFEDGSTIGYRLIRKSKGYNTGPDLVDTEGNSFFNMYSDLIMYTCYDGGIMATLWVLS